MKSEEARAIILQYPESECNCEECIKACTRGRTCWGFPEEIDILLDAGYVKSLMLDYYEYLEDDVDHYIEIVCPALVGYGGKNTPWWPKGRCSLLDENNRCRIHALKPTEGKLAHHSLKTQDAHHYEFAVVWETDEGRRVVEKWRELAGVYA